MLNLKKYFTCENFWSRYVGKIVGFIIVGKNVGKIVGANFGFITKHIFVLSRVWIPQTHLLRVIQTFLVKCTNK